MEVVERPTPSPGPGRGARARRGRGRELHRHLPPQRRLRPRGCPSCSATRAPASSRRVGAGVAGPTDRPDRVAWASAPGSYATHVAARADRLVPVPRGVQAQHSGGGDAPGDDRPLPRALDVPARAPGTRASCTPPRAGSACCSCRWRKRAGRTRHRRRPRPTRRPELARGAGADEVILYTARRAVRRASPRPDGGRGVDVVYDSVGAVHVRPEPPLAPAARHARALRAVERHASRRSTCRAQRRGSLFVTRPTLAPLRRDARGAPRARRRRARARSRAGDSARDAFTATYPLDEAAAAHRDLASRRDERASCCSCRRREHPRSR